MESLTNKVHYTLKTLDLYSNIQSVQSLRESTDFVILKFRLHTHTYLTFAIHKRVDMVEIRIRNSVIPIYKPLTLVNIDLIRLFKNYFARLRENNVNYYLETLSLLLDIIYKIYRRDTKRYKIDYLSLPALTLDCYFFRNKLSDDEVNEEMEDKMKNLIKTVNAL